MPASDSQTFIVSAAGTQAFGYHASEDRGRRAPRAKVIQHEDVTLNQTKRDKVASNARDVLRNFSIASWAIRKHLDYTTAFNLQLRTGDDTFDKAVELFLAKKFKKENIDAARRHDLRRLCRMAEGRRAIDGDVGFNRVGWSTLRGSVQTIEADRIRNPHPIDPKDKRRWINGVALNPWDQATAYAIYKRDGKGLAYDREIPARQMFLHAYWDHTQRFDQVRGITPLTAAIDPLCDAYEGIDLVQMRLKVEQLLGLKITRTADNASSYVPDAPDTEGLTEEEAVAAQEKYEVNMNGGPFMLDMEPGDDASFLDLKTPSAGSVEFLKLVIFVALKALDIPISFFDESLTNFFGSRGALLHYLRSCETKIADLTELLNWITDWVLMIAIMDGELIPPRQMAPEDITWEWVPAGVPWWDPSKETIGAVKAIRAGLDNPQRICRASGTDFDENLQQIAAAVTRARGLGIQLEYDLNYPAQ